MTMAGGGGLDVKRTEGLMRRLCLVLDQWRLAVVKGNHQLAAIVAQLYPLADQGQQRNQRGQIRPPSVPKQCCGAEGVPKTRLRVQLHIQKIDQNWSIIQIKGTFCTEL